MESNEKIDLSFIVVNYNSGPLLQKAIESIIKHTRNLAYEIIVVDNASIDNSLEFIGSIQTPVTVINNQNNLGFSKANNIGIRHSKGNTIVLLNQDIWIESNIFEPMYKFIMEDRSIGILGCKIVFANRSVQTSTHSYTSLGKQLLQLASKPFRPFASMIVKRALLKKANSCFGFGKIIKSYFLNYIAEGSPIEVECITGACIMFRKEIINSVGLLDESFFMYYEDEDFCRRTKNSGLKVAYLPSVSVVHSLGWRKNKYNIRLIKERRRSFNYYCSKYYKKKYIYYNFYKLLYSFLFGFYFLYVKTMNLLLGLKSEALPDRVSILGININNISFETTLQHIEEKIDKQANVFIVTPNVHHLMLLQKDGKFRKVYQEASLVVADGMLLIWAAGFLGTPLKEKISGSDLVPEICKLAEKKGYKLFFLGGRPGAAQQAKENLERIYPAIRIVGAYSPAYGFGEDNLEEQKVLQMIKKAHPDILFVGLGVPKQEKWIYRHYKELGVPVSMGVGVTFEFISGMVKRAPLWMQKIGLEWSWRLMMEPKRLWKRYLIDDMKFFWLVFKQKLSQSKSYAR